MIVADTNLIAYLLIPGPFGVDADRVRRSDEVWIAPALWRSELLNVLTTGIRTGTLTLPHAQGIFRQAESVVITAADPPDPLQVLALAATSGCTSYDCEFVALAQAAGVPLVTADRKVLAAFPGTAVSLGDFATA